MTVLEFVKEMLTIIIVAGAGWFAYESSMMVHQVKLQRLKERHEKNQKNKK